jgi:nucleoid DNA-binding protein/cell division septation protein DedD
MIPVETVIRKLIVDYEFVILPGFGALISRQVPVNYDRDSGLFSPPVKRLAFNESLKLDDGLLANYISRHENVTHSEAVTYVKRYADRLWEVLETRGETKIAGIGSFKANSEGKLVFDPTTERHFKDEWYGFRSFSASLVTQHSNLTSNLKGNVVEELIEVVGDNEATGLNISWWRWASAAMLIGLIAYFGIDFVSNNAGNTSTLNPLSALFEMKPLVEDNVSKKAKGFSEAANLDASTVEEVSEPSHADPIEVAATELVPPGEFNKDIDAALLSNSGKYCVIAGAFKGNKQANVLLNELKNKGFTDAHLLPADKRSSKIKVAVQRFDVEKEAYLASRKLKDVTGEIGWVYKIK